MTDAPSPRVRARCALAAAALGIALATAGCEAPGLGPLPTASVPQPPSADDEGRLRAYATDMAARYAAHPDDKAVALAYATALRRLTQYPQAVAILQRLAVEHPHDMPVLAAYGKALADAGRLQEAMTVLENAHTPDRPNWSVLSAQGSVSDQLGDHARARAYYEAALKIVPNQPQVLSNLGLSYALEHKMPQAEAALRQAAAQPGADARVRQNLALVLTAEGNYGEAEAISRRDMPAIDAAQTVGSMREMVATSDTWRAPARRHVAKAAQAATHTASIETPQ